MTADSPQPAFERLSRVAQREALDDALEQLRRALPLLLTEPAGDARAAVEAVLLMARAHDPAEAALLEDRWRQLNAQCQGAAPPHAAPGDERG